MILRRDVFSAKATLVSTSEKIAYLNSKERSTTVSAVSVVTELRGTPEIYLTIRLFDVSFIFCSHFKRALS